MQTRAFANQIVYFDPQTGRIDLTISTATPPARAAKAKMTREWLSQVLQDRMDRDQAIPGQTCVSAARQWMRNGTNVRLTADLPYDAVLLHQRINRRGTKSILKAQLGLEGLWSV